MLTEDDGVSARGPVTRVLCQLAWTPDEVRVTVAAEGEYALPYDAMRVCLPPGEARRLALTGCERVALRA